MLIIFINARILPVIVSNLRCRNEFHSQTEVSFSIDLWHTRYQSSVMASLPYWNVFQPFWLYHQVFQEEEAHQTQIQLAIFLFRQFDPLSTLQLSHPFKIKQTHIDAYHKHTYIFAPTLTCTLAITYTHS